MFKEKTLCICEFESQHQMLQEKERLEKIGYTVTIQGHKNEAGGYCCPHYGNTCGYHDNYNLGK